MNTLDWILIAVAALSVVRGMWRGAVSQVFGIVGVIGGFYLASHYCIPVGFQLKRALPSLPQPVMIAFVVLFFLTWFVLALAGGWLSRWFQRGAMGWLDRILGAGIGGVKGMLVAVLLVSFLTFFLPPESPILRQSKMAPYVHQVAQWIVKTVPKRLHDRFEYRRKKLYRYWSEKRQV